MPAIPGAPEVTLGLFGSIPLKASISPHAVKWADLKARVEAEKAAYARCGADPACPPAMKAWRAHLASLQGLPPLERIRRLNREINRLVAYRDDPVAFGKDDHWATPLETFRNNGDCEDYAILKFYSLLELGFDMDSLRLAIVRDTRRRLLHAVTTVELADRTYVLDNLFDEPVEHQYVLKYAPSYSANLDGQWVHIVTGEIRAKFVEQIQQRLARRDAAPEPASLAPSRSSVEYRIDPVALRSAWT